MALNMMVKTTAMTSIALLLAACGGTAATSGEASTASEPTNAATPDSAGAEEPLVIGVDYSVLAVPFVTAVQRGLQEEAADLGGITLIERDAEGKSEKTASDIAEILTRNPDGLIVSGNGAAATLGALRPALERGIPIVTNISQVGTQDEAVPPGTSILAFVAQNEDLAGREAAKLVMQALPEGGKYAIVLGATGFSENTTRVGGFKEELANSGMTYTSVAEQPGDWTPDRGQAACQNMLAANPDIELFYALSDDMGVGCINAIRQANSDALVVGVGGSKGGIQAVKDGEMFGNIWYAPEEIGRQSIRVLVEYLRNGTVPNPNYVETPILAVTRDNVDSVTAQW